MLPVGAGSGQELFQPLAEDPDMVLVHHDGMLSRGLRGPIPKLLKFTAKYPGKLEGPLQNSFEVDRWLLSDLDRPAWEETAKQGAAALLDQGGQLPGGGRVRQEGRKLLAVLAQECEQDLGIGAVVLGPGGGEGQAEARTGGGR